MGAVPDYAASMIEAGSSALAKAFESLPENLQTLRPMDKGRSALDQVQECAFINGFVAQILSLHQIPEFDRAQALAERQSHDTADKALAYLSKNTGALVGAIRAFPEDKIAETVVLPFFGPNGITRSFAQLFEMPNWNMAYHEGQINYIKNLFGEV